MTRKKADCFRSGSLVQGLRIKNRGRREHLTQLAQASGLTRKARNDILPQLVLETIPVDALQMAPRRLRKADAAHVREVSNAIAAFGFCDPILVGQGNLVIDGEIRIEAARQCGLSALPCVRIDHLSNLEQRALRLAANRLGEKGQWDLPALKIEFEELILLDAPIEIAGFSLPEIDSIISSDEVFEVESGPFEAAKDGFPVARLGDLFLLGDHRIVCGDARDPEALQVLMGETKARLVLTDEPYNVPIVGHVTGGAHRSFDMAVGEMTSVEFVKFNSDWMTAAAEHLCDGGLMATFIDWRGLPTVNAAAASLALDPLNLIVWAKTNGGRGSLYRSQHELLPIFKKGKAPHVNNVQLGKSGRWRSNVWTYPGASSLGSDARRGLQDHPTVKPTVMLHDALLDLTMPGEAVLDPFLGSGSTLMACEKAGRICCGIELDPLYVDLIIRRFESQTRKAAILDETGESFTTLKANRSTAAAMADK